MVLTLGMGALGALLGLMIAWSASPVVATIMPLLFGLVGGAGSFSLLKMDLGKPGAQQKLQTLGASLLSCCSTCLVTLVVAVLTRGYVLQTIENEVPTYSLGAEQLTNPVSAIDRLLLRRRLVAIGASTSEIRGIMGAGQTSDFKAAADTIGKAVTALLAARDQLQAADQQKADGVPDFARLVLAARYFSLMKGRMDAAAPMTEDEFRLLTHNLYAVDFIKVLPTDSTAKTFTDHPGLVAAITDVAKTLRKGTAVPDPSVRTSNMDDLIRLTASASSKSGDPGKLLAGRVDPLQWTSK